MIVAYVCVYVFYMHVYMDIYIAPYQNLTKALTITYIGHCSAGSDICLGLKNTDSGSFGEGLSHFLKNTQFSISRDDGFWAE